MSYADRITTIIEALKLEPNSEAKNKTLSNLKDAWAWAKKTYGRCEPTPNVT